MANKNVQVRKDNRPSGMLDVIPDFENILDRFFEPSFSPMLRDWSTMGSRYASNVQENDKYYLLTCEVPGIPKDDIEVNVNGNMLTIRAEHKEESSSSDREQSYQRQYRSFQQSFSLPTTVDPEKIEANCENGILEVVLPKTAQAQAKKIEVQSGKGGLLNRLLGKSEGSENREAKDKEAQAKH
jgi:HSP20 family protein